MHSGSPNFDAGHFYGLAIKTLTSSIFDIAAGYVEPKRSVRRPHQLKDLGSIRVKLLEFTDWPEVLRTVHHSQGGQRGAVLLGTADGGAAGP